MKKLDRALPYAVQSGDTDLIELVMENLPYSTADLYAFIAGVWTVMFYELLIAVYLLIL
jgi:hypothetical protein